jgi:hypothetical protein
MGSFSIFNIAERLGRPDGGPAFYFFSYWNFGMVNHPGAMSHTGAESELWMSILRSQNNGCGEAQEGL